MLLLQLNIIFSLYLVKHIGSSPKNNCIVVLWSVLRLTKKKIGNLLWPWNSTSPLTGLEWELLWNFQMRGQPHWQIVFKKLQKFLFHLLHPIQLISEFQNFQTICSYTKFFLWSIGLESCLYFCPMNLWSTLALFLTIFRSTSNFIYGWFILR